MKNMYKTRKLNRILLLLLLMALLVSMTACAQNTKGTIKFYTEATEEFTDPISSVSVDLSAKQIRQLKRIIKNADYWYDDNAVNRLEFVFDGEFEFSDTEYVYYFSYTSKIIYYDHYFAEIPEKNIQLIRDISTENK